MKKLLLTTIILAALAAAYLVVSTKQSERRDFADSTKPTIKIGTIFPLTGNMAHVGKSLQGAVQVAVFDANNNPENKYYYELVCEDSTLNMAKSAAIASKLISIDNIDALISFSADIGNAVNPVAEANKTIHFAMSVDPNGASGRYNFINWTMPNSSTTKMMNVIKEKNFNNVAIVSFNQTGALANSEMLREKLNNAGIKNTLYKFNGDMRDFRTDIDKINSTGADLYVLRLFEPQMSIFIKQLREKNINAQITSVELFGLVEDKSSVEGLWYIDVAGENYDKLEDIRHHNKSKQDYALAMAYDDVMLLVDAFEKANTKEQAVEVLSKLKTYHGIAGTMTQNEEGIFDSEASFRIVGKGN